MPKKKKNAYFTPFSLRLSFEERARLELDAGDLPLGAYIRSSLFSDPTPRKRRMKRPIKDYKILAELLTKLGSSRISNNLTLVYNGLRWHIRGYDRKRERFGDFVLTRFRTAKLSDSPSNEHEKKDFDIQWNRIVELDLVPHPNLKHKDAVELDYQMTEGVLKIKIRAAVAGYLMRLWNVDCSKDHSQEGNEYHLAIYPPLKTSPIRAENHSKYLEFKRAWI